MKITTTNKESFKQLDENALSFYHKHGWVVLQNQITATQIVDIQKSWQQMVNQFASDIDVANDRYLKVISQWRDVWKHDSTFKHLLTILSPLAAAGLELPGVRLLHDHLICKAAHGSNGVIPWHQDSMYWPVDRTGLSTWLATQDTSVEHGCLEVADGSHQWGIAPPVDFMENSSPFPNGARTSLLPVSAGDIVVLHSLTWHCSAETQKKDQRRLAHIALWLPEQTHYWPNNADWHPVNEQVSVAEGELLNEDEFPIFGERTSSVGNSVESKHQGAKPQGMFNAKPRVESEIQKMLNIKQPLFKILRQQDNRARISEMLATTMYDRNRTVSCVEKLWIGIAANEKHRSRNVFGSVYTEWREIYASFTKMNI